MRPAALQTAGCRQDCRTTVTQNAGSCGLRRAVFPITSSRCKNPVPRRITVVWFDVVRARREGRPEPTLTIGHNPLSATMDTESHLSQAPWTPSHTVSQHMDTESHAPPKNLAHRCLTNGPGGRALAGAWCQNRKLSQAPISSKTAPSAWRAAAQACRLLLNRAASARHRRG